MAKFRTLSQKFLKGHPREGQPTYFVEKFLVSIGAEYESADYYHKLCALNPEADRDAILSFYMKLEGMGKIPPKPHTIRQGNHFKAGDLISIRAWLGTPYNSTPIKLWDDLEVVATYPYHIANNMHYLNYSITALTSRVAKNDGLSVDDFIAWFPSQFTGQVICWKEVNY
jgi:hypothetical protein